MAIQHLFYDCKKSKYEDIKKELEKEALSLKLWRFEQEVSLQAPCINFWDKLESIGVIEAKVRNALQK